MTTIEMTEKWSREGTYIPEGIPVKSIGYIELSGDNSNFKNILFTSENICLIYYNTYKKNKDDAKYILKTYVYNIIDKHHTIESEDTRQMLFKSGVTISEIFNFFLPMLEKNIDNFDSSILNQILNKLEKSLEVYFKYRINGSFFTGTKIKPAFYSIAHISEWFHDGLTVLTLLSIFDTLTNHGYPITYLINSLLDINKLKYNTEKSNVLIKLLAKENISNIDVMEFVENEQFKSISTLVLKYVKEYFICKDTENPLTLKGNPFLTIFVSLESKNFSIDDFILNNKKKLDVRMTLEFGDMSTEVITTNSAKKYKILNEKMSDIVNHPTSREITELKICCYNIETSDVIASLDISQEDIARLFTGDVTVSEMLNCYSLLVVLINNLGKDIDELKEKDDIKSKLILSLNDIEIKKYEQSKSIWESSSGFIYLIEYIRNKTSK